MIRPDAALLSLAALCVGCGGASATARPAARSAPSAGAQPAPNAVLVLSAPPGPATRRRAASLGLRFFVASRAAGPAATAGAGIERALAYYRDFEFARSLEVLDGVDATLARTARDRDDVRAAVRAQVLRAANELALQREPAAVDALRAAAVLLEPADAEPDDASPELRARLATLRAELAAAPPARVAFAVRPPGARVRVDGNELSDPAQQAALPPGRHFVHVERDGSEPRVATVDLASGEQRRVEIALGPALADTAREQVSSLGPAALERLAVRDRRALGDALVAGEVWRIERRGETLVGAAIPLGQGVVRTARATALADEDRATASVLAGLALPQGGREGSGRGSDTAPSESVLASPWLWIAAAAVVVAAGVTIVVVAAPPARRGVLSIE